MPRSASLLIRISDSSSKAGSCASAARFVVPPRKSWNFRSLVSGKSKDRSGSVNPLRPKSSNSVRRWMQSRSVLLLTRHSLFSCGQGSRNRSENFFLVSPKVSSESPGTWAKPRMSSTSYRARGKGFGCGKCGEKWRSRKKSPTNIEFYAGPIFDQAAGQLQLSLRQGLIELDHPTGGLERLERIAKPI